MAQSDATNIGLWEPITYRFNHLPVHVALLHTGKVLAFGGTGNDETNEDRPYPAEIWDPLTGITKTIDQELAGDIFCAGHSFLSDGRLVVAGGTYKYDRKLTALGQTVPLAMFSGLEHSYLFDPIEEAWTRADDMGSGRWYPTLITLGDGQILAMAGLTKQFPWAFLKTIEMYSPEHGWRSLEGADRWLPLYPRLHLLPDGGVFYAGSFNTHYTAPFSIRGFPTAILNVQDRTWLNIGLPNQSEREEGTTVLLPLEPPHYQAKVLLAGGGTPGGKEALPDAEVIDLSAANPAWRTLQPMKNARYYLYPVILPDKTVLVLGGRRGETDTMEMPMPPGNDANFPQDPNAIHDAELFDPATETWTTLAPMKLDRLYHASALLLPDGRVMTAGSNPARRVNELRIETYMPPYLFKGPRPTIEEVPLRIGYGEAFQIRTPDAKKVDAVALIRNSVTTHCVNTEQRYLGLEFQKQGSNHLLATIPNNRNLAPPGFYMLFILHDGIPSIAKFICLK